MIWVMIGATSTFIVADFGLTAAQQGLMVGIPILGGAILRIPMGLLADRYGGKKIGIIGDADYDAATSMGMAIWKLFK